MHLDQDECLGPSLSCVADSALSWTKLSPSLRAVHLTLHPACSQLNLHRRLEKINTPTLHHGQLILRALWIFPQSLSKPGLYNTHNSAWLPTAWSNIWSCYDWNGEFNCFWLQTKWSSITQISKHTFMTLTTIGWVYDLLNERKFNPTAYLV